MAYYEFTIKIPETFKDTLIHRLSKAGCLGVIENDEFLVAYFPEKPDISDVKTDLSIMKAILEKAGRSHELSYECALIPEQDWNAAWKKDFRPVDAGERFTILPPWEEKRPGRINLVIDPGMAFGTDHHETTRSCLVLMEKFSRPASPEARFLDLGTGTGLLAIAASHLGYKRVMAIDIDPLAIEATRRNIALNDAGIDIEVIEGDIARIDIVFDLIAANLIATVLINLAPAIASNLNPRGSAILAGILKGQEDEVIAAMESAGLAFREKLIDGKWVSVVAVSVKKKIAISHFGLVTICDIFHRHFNRISTSLSLQRNPSGFPSFR